MVTAGGVRVVDEEMTDVPANGKTMGEIVMRGNTVMAGYYLDPEATAQAFRGGWFHSGDLGVRYPDGYIELRDRAKDIVISGGENISTVEVEQALMSHPCVLEAAVVGVPDEKWGERPKAFVVLHAGTSAIQQELIAHVRTKIAGYKAPREVDIIVELPEDLDGEGREIHAARQGTGQPRPACERLPSPAQPSPAPRQLTPPIRPPGHPHACAAPMIVDRYRAENEVAIHNQGTGS